MITKEDLQVECHIIGSIIIDEGTHGFIEQLNKDDFIDNTNKKIFDTIINLHREQKNIDLFTIYNTSGVPLSHLASITNTIATTSTIGSSISILKDKSSRRKLIQKANKIIDMALDDSTDIETIKNDAAREIDEIDTIVDDEVVSLKDSMLETIGVLDKRYSNKDDKSYYIGLSKLDRATAGLHPEELTTIGARPGVGKTILGMQIALNIAKNKKKVLFTSLEMSTTQLCERIISAYAQVDSLKLRLGEIETEDDWDNIYKVANEFAIDNFLLDKTSRNPQHIRAKLRKHKPELIVIDYLQLLQSTQREQSREREVATITRDLKLMCLEFKIPIIILSQLNRNAEGQRPTMADLRESGAIEQDSDNILFIHEPTDKEINKLIDEGIYGHDFVELLEERESKLSQIIIEKQRNGPVGTFEMIKAPKLMRFVEIERGM